MINQKVRCSIISVDCVPNDSIDIRCGGPTFLGFDFIVLEIEEEKMIKFITETINFFDIPLISVHKSNTISTNKQNVWDKKKIVNTIERDSKYLKEEAQRYQPISSKK